MIISMRTAAPCLFLFTVGATSACTVNQTGGGSPTDHPDGGTQADSTSSNSPAPGAPSASATGSTTTPPAAAPDGGGGQTGSEWGPQCQRWLACCEIGQSVPSCEADLARGALPPAQMEAYCQTTVDATCK
jgi:hypothetical protein